MKQNQTDCGSTYQTGKTNPPKNYHNVIAVLLMVIIVLCSVVTIMGMMNIRLSKLQESQEPEAPSDEPQEQLMQLDSQPRAASLEVNTTVLGLSCEEMDNIYRSYHQLPHGLYVSYVEPGRADLQVGDIIVACDEKPVTNKDRFFRYVGELDAGSTVTLTVFRDEGLLTVDLIV